jgi:hypothetical protein
VDEVDGVDNADDAAVVDGVFDIEEEDVDVSGENVDTDIIELSGW